MLRPQTSFLVFIILLMLPNQNMLCLTEGKSPSEEPNGSTDEPPSRPPPENVGVFEGADQACVRVRWGTSRGEEQGDYPEIPEQKSC